MSTSAEKESKKAPQSGGICQFEPRFMKISVLTAALQELTRREARDPDPDLAVEEWLEFARDLGAGDAFRLVVNNGAQAGQSVFHLHLHIIAGRRLKWPPG